MAAALASNTIPQLVVPPQAVARHPDTIVKPGELLHWLEDLPLADSQHLAELLHRQIKLLIRDPNPDARYPELLRAYHPVLCSLQNQVWENLAGGRSSVKSPELLRSTVSQLLLEIACGHMRMINRQIAGGDTPSNTDLYHAMLPLLRLLQWDVVQYNLTRPSVWRQVLQLFSISELYCHSGEQVDSELALDFDARDIHGTFFATLVVLLCDPYRLPAHGLSRLISGLGELAEHLRINGAGQANYRIPVDLSGRLPPLRYARQPGDSTSIQYLQLDEFFQQLGSIGLAGDQGSLNNWLQHSLRELALKPAGRESRRHNRHKRTADYHFVHGLHRVHQRLGEIQAGQPSAQNPDPNNTGIILEEAYTATSVELGVPCHQTDHSLSGAGFMLGARAQAPAVGSWVLFEADSVAGGGQSGQGFVGQVRRRLQFNDGSSEIGVEKLRGSIIPVRLGIDRHPTLLHANREDGVFQLIAPGGSFRTASRHTLHGANKDYQVMFEELLEGDSIERIRISLL